MKIIHVDCQPQQAKDKSLPINSYIVTYRSEGQVCYDVVQASSQVEIFDYYYDFYGKGGIQNIKWTDGTVNPKVWSDPTKKKK